jgi:H-type lectin domain
VIDIRYEEISLQECNQTAVDHAASVRIEFPHVFASTPKVLGLTMIDTNTGPYARVKLVIKSVDKDHFDAELLNWADSVIYGIEFDCGCCQGSL